jgi:hypothetical protein
LELAQEEALGKDPHRKKSLGPRKMIPSEERRPPYTPGCINDMAGDSAGFPTVDSWVSLAIDAEGILGGGEARTPALQISALHSLGLYMFTWHSRVPQPSQEAAWGVMRQTGN